MATSQSLKAEQQRVDKLLYLRWQVEALVVEISGGVHSAHVLPVLRQNAAVNNQFLKLLKPSIIDFIGQSLGLKIVEEHVDFVGCKRNTHVGGKIDRCSNQSNNRKYLLVETDGLVIPKSLLEDQHDLRNIFQELDKKLVLKPSLRAVPVLRAVRIPHLLLDLANQEPEFVDSQW